jgi:hypothetical protein
MHFSWRGIRRVLRPLVRQVPLALVALFGPELVFLAGVCVWMMFNGQHSRAMLLLEVPGAISALALAAWAVWRGPNLHRFWCALVSAASLWDGVQYVVGPDDTITWCALLWFAWSLWFFHCFMRDRFDYDNFTKVYE